jgi:hypothetical protein
MASAILCPVCGTTNHHLAVTCSSCGSFVQGRVETLDLFATMWGVLERPGRAFYKIAIARHKNYSLFLSALAGIAVTFLTFWLVKIGDHTESILSLIAGGFVLGPFVGVLSLLIFSAIVSALASVTRTRMSFRNTLAVSSYASVPIILSLVFTLPIELMSFGVYFFASNPSPYALRPTSYVLLVGLNVVFTIWTIVLLVVGARKLSDRGLLRSAVLALLPLLIYVGLVSGLIRLFLQGVL